MKGLILISPASICSSQVLPYVIEIGRVVPLVVFPAIQLAVGGGLAFGAVGVLLYFSLLLVLTVAAVVNTGDETPRCLNRIVRSELINSFLTLSLPRVIDFELPLQPLPEI